MMKLSPRLIKAYHRQIDRLHAAEMLDLLAVAIAPHTNTSERRDLYDDLLRRVRAEEEKIVELATVADLKRFLAEI